MSKSEEEKRLYESLTVLVMAAAGYLNRLGHSASCTDSCQCSSKIAHELVKEPVKEPVEEAPVEEPTTESELATGTPPPPPPSADKGTPPPPPAEGEGPDSPQPGRKIGKKRAEALNDKMVEVAKNLGESAPVRALLHSFDVSSTAKLNVAQAVELEKKLGEF